MEEVSQTQPSRRTTLRTLAVLTLRRHEDGIWITTLVERLREKCAAAAASVRVEVVTLESLDLEAFAVDSSPPWSAVVNRVSDAAGPALSKACLAILNACKIWAVPVFNGPSCYSLGCNKLLHHHVFSRAGLKSPRSVVLRLGGDYCEADEARRKARSAAGALEEKGCEWPFLLKPNSAGFGAGIERFEDVSELERHCDALKRDGSSVEASGSNDGVALLQEYIRPADGKIYRIWFLRGEVQCAVSRSIGLDESTNGRARQLGAAEFRGGCIGGTCSMNSDRICGSGSRSTSTASGVSKKVVAVGCVGQTCSRIEESNVSAATDKTETTIQPTFSSWAVSDDIVSDVRRIQHVVGEDCHAGSIEFIIDKNGGKVYFDLNMLSTLPLVKDGNVDNSEHVWGSEFDPWGEMADAILRVSSLDSIH